MKAIRTKYLGPTTHKGSRMKADDFDGNSVTISYNHRFDADENHRIVCKELLRKMNWYGSYSAGWTDKGMVWVDPSDTDCVACHIKGA